MLHLSSICSDIRCSFDRRTTLSPRVTSCIAIYVLPTACYFGEFFLPLHSSRRAHPYHTHHASSHNASPKCSTPAPMPTPLSCSITITSCGLGSPYTSCLLPTFVSAYFLHADARSIHTHQPCIVAQRFTQVLDASTNALPPLLLHHHYFLLPWIAVYVLPTAYFRFSLLSPR
jgi:hypothetical protein